ncbi:MAG: HAD family hydrolase [Caldilineaceae bacterium]|nr:HAD family hydrolase [Caldilineaceae bacterium]
MISPSAIDLVILDLDGTVIDLFHSGVPSPRVSAAIAAVQAAGIPLTVGTGRTLDYLRQQLSALHLTYPVVTAHGCVVGDPQTGTIYREATIPESVVAPLLAWLDASSLVTALYVNDDQGHTHLYQNRPSRTAADQRFHDHVFGNPRTLQPSLSALYTTPHAHAPMKFICDNDPTTEADLFPAITAAFGTELYLTRTHPRLFEGMAPGVNKGTGLHVLCELLQIDPARVLAIGDNDNDIPMLEVAGHAIAMGNATPGVKAVADWVAPSIEEDGAAVVLEWLV